MRKGRSSSRRQSAVQQQSSSSRESAATAADRSSSTASADETLLLVSLSAAADASSAAAVGASAQQREAAAGCAGPWPAAFLNAHTMEVRGIGCGDVVLISSSCAQQVAAAAAWASNYVARRSVEISELLAANAAAAAGGLADVVSAKDPPRVLRCLVVQKEAPDSSVSAAELPDFVAAALATQYICVGNVFPVRACGNEIRVRVVGTVPPVATPEDVFVLGPSTKIVLARTPNTDSEASKDDDEVHDLERATRSTVSFGKDVAGVDDIVELLEEAVSLPLRSPETFSRYGIKPPKGVLLCGPSGVGKSLLARAIAGAAGASLFLISGSESMSRFVGESEANLRKVFASAARHSPAVIVIDDIDALCPSRDESQSEVDKRVVSTLLTLMDGIAVSKKHRVSVVATTSKPNTLDPALRRAGRFDKEIEVGVPKRTSREAILRLCLGRTSNTMSDEQIARVAEVTHGFVGADISALVRTAALHAFRRASKALPPSAFACASPSAEAMALLAVTDADFSSALTVVKPSAMREVAVDVPRVRWTDIGGHADVKKKLQEAVEWPVKHPEIFDAMGITPPCGVLLYGPPGCAKTLMAQALATETGLNFIAVKGPQLLSKYVGESERAVREVFRKARQNAPSIIFFDEIDGLVGRERGADSGGGTSRVLSQLLTEMDGIQPLRNVAIVAATNRPDMIDPALLRPGRIDRALFLGPPDRDARIEILRVHARNIPHDEADIASIADRTEGCTGADVSAICSTAALLALRESMSARAVARRHWDQALAQRPSASALRPYDSTAWHLSQVPQL